MKDLKERDLLKKKITEEIESFLCEFKLQNNLKTDFGRPIIGFADSFCPEIQDLPNIVSKNHALPQDVMEDAGIIISYYVPFTRDLAMTNRNNSPENLASPQWACAYEELNYLFKSLNEHIIDFVKGLSLESAFKAAISTESLTFSETDLISNWSQRHIAYAAGLGTFGVNNMLITPAGCCGRYSSVITNIPTSVIAADSPRKDHLCLYYKDPSKASCLVCVKNCPGKALTYEEGIPSGRDLPGGVSSAVAQPGEVHFDRKACFIICSQNAEIHPVSNSLPWETKGSYDLESGEGENEDAPVVGSQVCGKCVTASPCAFWNVK